MLTLPGLGKMPYEEICAALKEIGYQGLFTLEADNFIKNLPDALLPSAVAFMAKNARYYASLCE